MAVALIVLVVAVVLYQANAEDEVTALGNPIEDASDELRQAERLVDRFTTDAQEDGGADIATGDELRCWFSYPEGEDEPNDFIRCGPLLYADSAPDAYWLNLPVTYAGHDGSTSVSIIEEAVEPWRTHALAGGERLVHPRHTAPDVDDIDLTRPGALEADPGEVASIDPEFLAIDLGEEPEDGRLAGLGVDAEVLAFDYTDRVRVSGGDEDPAVVKEAAEGERWLVAEVRVSNPLLDATGDPFDPANLYDRAFGTTLGLRVDGTDVALPEGFGATNLDNPLWVPDEKPATIAVSVPEEAEEIALKAIDNSFTQEWSFVTGERSGAPAILYRDEAERFVTIDGDYALPYAAKSPDEPVAPSSAFGSVGVRVKVTGASLDYGVNTTDFGSVGERHVASKPDRALLHLRGVAAEWPDTMHSRYRIKPEDAVLTLEDGTKVTSQKVGDDTFSNFLPATLVWDVPADLTKATLTIKPSPDEEYYTIDFQGGVIEIPLTFEG